MVFIDENQEKLLEYFEGSSELFDPLQALKSLK